MFTFIVRRTSLAVLTIWVLSILSFLIIQLPPGDYVDHYVIQPQRWPGGGSVVCVSCTWKPFEPFEPYSHSAMVQLQI